MDSELIEGPLAALSRAFREMPFGPEEIELGRSRQEQLELLGTWDVLLAGRRSAGDEEKIHQAQSMVRRLENGLGLSASE